MYRADATITEKEYKDICEVVRKATEITAEWLDDCIEQAEEATGIEIPERLRGRAVEALELTLNGYNRVDEFINYGFTMTHPAKEHVLADMELAVSREPEKEEEIRKFYREGYPEYFKKETKMKNYRLIDNIEKWGTEAYYGLVIDEEELNRLAHDWDMDTEGLMKDLEEVDMYEVVWVAGEHDGETIASFETEADAIQFAKKFMKEHEEEFDPVCGGVAIYDPTGEVVENW